MTYEKERVGMMSDMEFLAGIRAFDWSKAQVKASRYAPDRVDWWQFTETRAGHRFMLIGEDTDGDGTVDFIHADTTGSGRLDFSAYLQEGSWFLTNLLEAWLEINFSLPWSRDNYLPHNVDIRFNGITIASFKDSLPEGHYSFAIPPRAVRFPGEAADNVIEVVSQHLRGGHYIITSDFQVVYRLTVVDTYIIAGSREEATQKVLSTPGFRFRGGDLAVNSNDLFISKTRDITPGERLEVKANLYNLGMDPVRDVTVAFMQTLPGGSNPVEISRLTLPEVPLYGPTAAVFSWIAVPGHHTLSVTIDPEGILADNSRFNNRALLNVWVHGKDTAPQVEISSPMAGQKFDRPEVLLEAQGIDETGILLMEYRVDGGIWEQRRGVDHLRETITVQPGDHVLHVRATDCSGNTAEDFRAITVDFPRPFISIVEPGEGFITALDRVTVVVELADPAAGKSLKASTGGGAWREIYLDGQKRVSIDLPLEFGKQMLEIKLIDRSGVETMTSRMVECTAQVE